MCDWIGPSGFRHKAGFSPMSDSYLFGITNIHVGRFWPR